MKKALITGGTKGIGFAIAQGLAKEGCDIVMTYLHDADTAKDSQDIIKGLGVTCEVIQADSGKKGDIEEIFTIHQGFDVLINNVGGPFPDDGENDWLGMFNYHLMGTVRTTELFARQLQGEGSIINISSVAGSNPFARHNCVDIEAYCCMKAAVDMYTKLCSNKYAGKIRVNAISPGNTRTPAREGALQESISKREKNSLINRFVTSNEVADAILAVIKNKGINGQIITVDGGVVARGYEN